MQASFNSEVVHKFKVIMELYMQISFKSGVMWVSEVIIMYTKIL